MILAYWTDKCLSKVMEAKFDPIFQRLMHCEDDEIKWRFCNHNLNGKKGILAFLSSGVAGPSPAELSEPVESPIDGLWYFRPDPLPTQKQLAKSHSYPSIDYKTYSGYTLSIPLAAGSPKSIDFMSLSLGGDVDAFPAAVAEMDVIIDSSKEAISIIDPRILKIVLMAIMQTYKVTPELLSELNWISSNDANPIFNIIRGIDPKLESSVEDTSDLSLLESSKMEHVHLSNGSE